MKKLLSVILMFAVASVASAREITSSEAGRAAAAWARRDSSPLGAKLSATDAAEVLTARDGDTPIYHVVRLSGGGVVVTSAESGVTPVVAFFDGEAPEEGDGNPIWEILSADMASRTRLVAAVREEAATADAGTKRFLLGAAAGASEGPFASEESAWAELLAEDASPRHLLKAASIDDASCISDLRVAPLLKTVWGQLDGVANYYTPPYESGNTNNYPCGCVALAGAQIANYWRFPTEPCEQVEMECYTNRVPQTFSTIGGKYDWQNMPTDFSSPTEEQKQAVGKLCYDMGVLVRMSWEPGGSAANDLFLLSAFRDAFGYASANGYVSYLEGTIPPALVERGVLANLDAKCPVAIGIDMHEAVADGYGFVSGTLYTHINLGWNGSANAWYNLPEVDATAYGKPYASSVFETICYNIFPDETGELLTGRVLDGDGHPVAGATVVATNGSDTASAVTDDKGIYALHVAGGKTWSISATSGERHGSGWAPVAISESTDFEFDVEGWQLWYKSPGAVGNSWGNDITLGVEIPLTSLSDALDAPALTFTSGGISEWFGETMETSDGVDAARSGIAINNSTNWLETTVDGPGIISFWWNVSSEEECDWLEFHVDGALDSRISGTNTTWAQKFVEVSGDGPHTLRWSYLKDAAAAIGSDCGWVDQVVWRTQTYSDWAAENGIAGAWNGTSGGVCNIFRYVFDVPSGEFADPPIIDIAVEDGKVVVKTPPKANSIGVTVSVVESSDVAGETVTDTKELTAEGRAEFGKSDAAQRFYRLNADVM